MSKFYGQVEGSSQTLATRRGHNRIKSSVQSYDGSLIFTMFYEDGELIVRLETADDFAFYGDIIFQGTIDELKRKVENNED